jgi:hypothetical protein
MPPFTARVWMMVALVLLADAEAGPLKHTLLLLMRSRRRKSRCRCRVAKVVSSLKLVM